MLMDRADLSTLCVPLVCWNQDCFVFAQLAPILLISLFLLLSFLFSSITTSNTLLTELLYDCCFYYHTKLLDLIVPNFYSHFLSVTWYSYTVVVEVLVAWTTRGRDSLNFDNPKPWPVGHEPL